MKKTTQVKKTASSADVISAEGAITLCSRVTWQSNLQKWVYKFWLKVHRNVTFCCTIGIIKGDC